MRMISFFTFTSSLRNGWVADQLSFGEMDTNCGSPCSQDTKSRTDCGGPAKNRLIPSSAIKTVPLSESALACAWQASRKAAVSLISVNR